MRGHDRADRRSPQKAVRCERLVHVCFGARYGLKSDITPSPESAINGRGQPSFDHFVSEREQRRRYFEAKRLGGFEVNTKPERDRLLHWNFAWSFPLQYLIDDSRRTSENICVVGAVGDECARRN